MGEHDRKKQGWGAGGTALPGNIIIAGVVALIVAAVAAFNGDTQVALTLGPAGCVSMVAAVLMLRYDP